jgi:hypothetical protein
VIAGLVEHRFSEYLISYYNVPFLANILSSKQKANEPPGHAVAMFYICHINIFVIQMKPLSQTMSCLYFSNFTVSCSVVLCHVKYSCPYSFYIGITLIKFHLDAS